MKKKFMVLVPICLFLVSCGNENKEVSENTSEPVVTQNSIIKKEEIALEPDVKLEGDTLSTPRGDFEFLPHDFFVSETEVPVMVVRFNYTNTTQENEQIQSVIWDYFQANQVTEDTTEPTGFFVFGEDEPYYEEVHKSSVDIHPGATVEAAYGFSMEFENIPLTVNFLDSDHEVIGSRMFKTPE